MKTYITAACFLSLAANLAAFELPVLDAAKVREAAGRQELPAARLSDSRGAEDHATFADWENLRASFFSAKAPSTLEELVGEYSGYMHPLYEREEYTVDFKMTIYRDAATGAIKATFPLYDDTETITLVMTPTGAAFADAWGGRVKLIIRKMNGKLYIMSDLYSNETYGTCSPAAPARSSKAAARPTGDLWDDMPHGAIPSDTETGPAFRILKNEFGVSGLTLDIPAAEISRQEKAYGGMGFETAFRSAMKNFFEDYSDIESPMCIVLDNLGGYSCENPSKTDVARARKKLRELMSLKGTHLRIVRDGGDHQPENCETVKENWVFSLYLDYSDHTYWGIVDRSGRKPAYNYGFN